MPESTAALVLAVAALVLAAAAVGGLTYVLIELRNHSRPRRAHIPYRGDHHR